MQTTLYMTVQTVHPRCYSTWPKAAAPSSLSQSSAAWRRTFYQGSKAKHPPFHREFPGGSAITRVPLPSWGQSWATHRAGHNGQRLLETRSYLGTWCSAMWKLTAAMRITLQKKDDWHIWKRGKGKGKVSWHSDRLYLGIQWNKKQRQQIEYVWPHEEV